LKIADAEAALPFLRLAAIQRVEYEDSLPYLSPECHFVAAQPVEREVQCVEFIDENGRALECGYGKG